MIALYILAAEAGAEPSKTPFYVAGGVLVLFAVVIAAVGTRGETFPATKGARTAVCLLAAVLVAAAMATAVITS